MSLKGVKVQWGALSESFPLYFVTVSTHSSTFYPAFDTRKLKKCLTLEIAHIDRFHAISLVLRNELYVHTYHVRTVINHHPGIV